MDEHRFDELTVSLATHRRTILRGLLAGAAGPLVRGAGAAAGAVSGSGDHDVCATGRPWSPLPPGSPECGRREAGACCEARRCGPLRRCSCAKAVSGGKRCIKDTSFFNGRRRCKSDRDCQPDSLCIDHLGCVGGHQLRCVKRCQA